MASRRFQIEKDDLSDSNSENEESFEERPQRRSNYPRKKDKDRENSDDSQIDSKEKRRVKSSIKKEKSSRAWDDDDDDDASRRSTRNHRSEPSREDTWAKKSQNRSSATAWDEESPKSNEKGSPRKTGWSSAKPTPKDREPPKTSKKSMERSDYDENDDDQEDEDDEDDRRKSNRQGKGKGVKESAFIPRSVPMPSKPKNIPPDIRVGQKYMSKDRNNGRPSSSSARRRQKDEEEDEDEDEEEEEEDDESAFDKRKTSKESTVSAARVHVPSALVVARAGSLDVQSPQPGRSGLREPAPHAMQHDTEDMDDELDADDVDENRMDMARNSRDGHGGMSSSLNSFVLVAHDCGEFSDHVQCVIVRDRTGIATKMTPTYRLFLEDKNKLLILAVKNQFNRTSNYHMYDMTRGQAGSKLTKKSGNYLGKLRARNVNRTEYVLITQASEREEVAAIVFDRHGIVDQLKEGSLPRKMSVMVPQLGMDGMPVVNNVSESGAGSMVDMLRYNDDGNMFVFESKEPVFENGNFRLNFRGRVSVPSVKNFQLVSPDDIDHVICQFGKIGDDRYHLDYKTPLNAFQAFALALCQFNL